MKVLSLFNGMNCIGLALTELGIDFELYASEIDKYANQVSNALFPNATNLGDVRLVRIALTYSVLELERFLILLKRFAKINDSKYQLICKIKELRNISFDLVVAGSPCQGFSFAGKQLNFRDKRSRLFFEFVKILEACKKKNPNVKFLLENVKMKGEYEAVISRFMGIDPIEINSALLSAQNRVRLYWTNIGTTKRNLFGIEEPGIKQPNDKGILLKDILELEVEEKYNLSIKGKNFILNPIRIKKKYTSINGKKALCLTAKGQTNWTGTFIGKVIQLNEINQTSTGQPQQQNRIYSPEGKSPCLDTNSRSKGILLVPEATKQGYTEIKDGECVDLTFIDSKTRRGRKMEDKSNCLTASKYDFCQWKNAKIRRLTPKECMRLQTVPEWAIEIMLNCGVSDSQLYKMLGNGWTVEVISYILSHLNQTQ